VGSLTVDYEEMAWDWVSPLVTGLIGVAGIAGTYFGAAVQRRGQLDAITVEQEHARRERYRGEKREAFLRFLEAHDELVSSAKRMREAVRSQQDIEAKRAEMNSADKMLQSGRNRLALYADPVPDLLPGPDDARRYLASRGG
jgi:hypothetical protein